MAQHFVHPPNWTWFIVLYFFWPASPVVPTSWQRSCASGAGRATRPSRVWAILALSALVVACAILLTIDLGRPLAFWHMLINTTPGVGGVNFKYWSPMSVGVWALEIFALFALVSMLEALGWIRRLPNFIPIIGSLLGLYLASYTGVLLSVSNQPIWSDTYALGGLFLASALSGAAALLGWLAYSKERPAPTHV